MIKTWDLVSVISIHPSSYHHATVTTSMHPPTYVCTHISVQRDYHRRKQILVCNHHKLSHNIIAKNKSLLKQGHRDTKNHGEMIDCITHHVCQEIQGVDEMVLMMLMKVLMLVLMMPLPEGGGVHRRWFRQRFPPPISAGGGLLTPFLCVFDLRRRLLAICAGGTFYSPF